MGTEVELKLATTKTGLRKTLALPWLKRAIDDGARRKQLVSVYFDTRTLSLHDHGMSLRVRRNGERRLQTVKANSAAPIERGEWESEIDRDRPNLELVSGTALASILTGKIAQHLKPTLRGNANSRKAFATGYLTGREEARASDLLPKALAAGKALKKMA